MEQTLNTTQSDLFFLWSLCFLALWPGIRIGDLLCRVPWCRQSQVLVLKFELQNLANSIIKTSFDNVLAILNRPSQLKTRSGPHLSSPSEFFSPAIFLLCELFSSRAHCDHARQGMCRYLQNHFFGSKLCYSLKRHELPCVCVCSHQPENTFTEKRQVNPAIFGTKKWEWSGITKLESPSLCLLLAW